MPALCKASSLISKDFLLSFPRHAASCISDLVTACTAQLVITLVRQNRSQLWCVVMLAKLTHADTQETSNKYQA